MSEEHGLVSISTLAAIEAAISQVLTGTDMRNMLEQYGFEAPPLSRLANKLTMARAHLRSADWTRREIVDRLLAMLSELFGRMASLKDYEGRSNLDKSPLAQRAIEALAQNEGVAWDGARFNLPPSAAFDHAADGVGRFGLAELDEEIRRINENVNHDPPDAITSARALVESACRHVLADYGEEPPAGVDLNALLNAVLARLQLTPENVTAEGRGRDSLWKVVRSMRAAVDGLVELRGLYGDPHGKGPGFKGLEPRHARLMATLAAAIATFLIETHECRNPSVPTEGRAQDLSGEE